MTERFRVADGWIASAAMDCHLLLYTYGENILQRRAPHRDAHLALIRREHEEGALMLAGAYGDPPIGGAFVFAGVGADRVRAFVDADPYIAAGLVEDWRIEPYHAVVTPASTVD